MGEIYNYWMKNFGKSQIVKLMIKAAYYQFWFKLQINKGLL